MLIAKIHSAENKPWTDSNFFKNAFLTACQAGNII